MNTKCTRLKVIVASLFLPIVFASVSVAATVYTPNGTPVTVTTVTTDFTSSEVAYWNSYVASTYPLATRETNATRKYNCHSYAWFSQSTSNNQWMDTPGDDTYWLDGSYDHLGNYNGAFAIPSSIPNGAKVSYKIADHSAIKVSSTQYRSKWGQGPRMRHAPYYCPYACSSCSFTVGYYD